MAAMAQDRPSLAALERALARLRHAVRGEDALAEGDRLAGQLAAAFGADALRAGPDPLVEELTALWAIEVPGALAAGEDVGVRVLADDGSFGLPLQRLGRGAVFAGAATLPHGTAFRWNYEVAAGPSERRTLLPDIPNRPVTAPSGTTDMIRRLRGRGRPLEVYATHPDERPQPGVPRGELVEYRAWRSAVFPGTTRDWWVYVPAGYRPERPACAMVFQDGGFFKDYVPTVLDNLIARGDMPVTAGVFVDAGVADSGESARSAEYDTLSDRYARFLLNDLLPAVERTVRLRRDPESRALAGASSGGICAWTAAWERPDQFGKVLSLIGSFADIRGGHNYPPLIRKAPPKPIRVFLQDGENDQNVPAGDWWLANLAMASALEFAGYDHQTVWGRGFHSHQHGRAILPDALRWLWRGWQP